jgi:hypothetical protein
MRQVPLLLMRALLLGVKESKRGGWQRDLLSGQRNIFP